tara:strand:+ start:106167 stop:107246 length:1080 start_codon:yes stop_codon:yes gene_type:complete
MSRLENSLQRQIQSDGPMDLARYMDICLLHPDYGYYVTRDPLGEKGDFTTAPEISQMFGEMIGIWSAILWNNINMPAALNLIEIGPGRGTLMADLLRGSQHVPGFHDALTISFVEKSPVLKKKQQEAMDASGFAGKVTWYDDISDYHARGPALVIANEFLDALPIRQLEFTDNGWMERRVGYAHLEGFFLGLSPANTEHTDMMPKHPKIGDIYEFSPARDAYLSRIIDVLAVHGGAALLVDYGHDQKFAQGDTFQAMRNHDYIDPFENPGCADLTSHVDFYRIRQVAESKHCHVYGSVEQGDLLHKLGIGQRAQMLCDKSPEQKDAIIAAYKRLTDKDKMGQLFRAMAITRKLAGEPLL